MAIRTVQVNTPNTFGSGGFIADDLVITAAHVIHPSANSVAYKPRLITVGTHDASPLRVIACLCLTDWTQSRKATTDMALLRVATPPPGEVVSYQIDAPANNLDVTINSYREGPNAGTVTCVTDVVGAKSLQSSNLSFHNGVSGSLIMSGSKAIGIVTRSFDTPTKNAFIGLPFLDTNITWLINNCG